MRLSAYLASKHAFSRRFAKTLIREGKVFYRGKTVASDHELTDQAGYSLAFTPPELSFRPEDFLVKAEDRVVFLYKPPAMHTERHTPLDPLCLDDVLKNAFPDYRLLSRLDYPVDGLVAAPKEGYKPISVEKAYLAWVRGLFPEALRGKWAVDAAGRRRVRAFPSEEGGEMRMERLAARGGRSLVRIILKEARRHQVRAVLAALGHPIEGDSLYNGEGEKGPLTRIFLHASRVSIDGISCLSPRAEGFTQAF